MKVLDSAGAIVNGQVVNFRVVAGGGTVFGGANITNSAGIAQERWTLGTSTADSQRVEVRAVDNATGAALTFAVFKAVALAGPPASMVSVVSDQSAAVRTAVTNSPAVRVADTYGNPVPGIAVTFAVASGGGTVSESSRTTNDSGVATLTAWILGPVAGTNTVTATVTGLPTVTFTATGTAGAPAVLAFAVQPSAAIATLPISPAVQVAVLDAFGNSVTGATDSVTIALATNSAAATLSGTLTVAATQGIATFNNLRIDRPGSDYMLAATAAGLSLTTSAPFVVTQVSFAAVSAGEAHTCGVTAAGAAYCWGLNDYGQLGDGTTTSRPILGLVAGGVSFAAVGAAGLSSCGLTPSGAAYCWGRNDRGYLGDGTTTDRSTPVLVTGGVVFVMISAGGNACGVAATGTAYCWGANNYGELGDGTTADRSSPALVTGGVVFAMVSALGEHTCGVATTGAAYCWGRNLEGQLGDGTTSLLRSSPGLVVGGLRFAMVSVGVDHTCGVTTSGDAYCWGDNVRGQLGDGTFANRSSPVLVMGGLSFAAVTAGIEYSCGVTVTGTAYCWGLNNYGQLGDGTTTTLRSTPVLVAGGLNFALVDAGSSHTCGITTSGAAYCWGDNISGELGDGTTTGRLSPVLVAGSRP